MNRCDGSREGQVDMALHGATHSHDCRHPAFTIRTATLADLDVLVSFTQLLAQEAHRVQLDPASLRSGIQAVLENAQLNSFYFLAVVGNERVGQMMLTSQWNDFQNGQDWWLRRIYVLRPYRRRGFARALLECAREFVTGTASARWLRAQAHFHNQASQRLLEQFGMARTTCAYALPLLAW